MVINLEKSRQLASTIVIRESDCFRNALRVAEARVTAIFVVGIVIDRKKPEKPIDHAWIELDGEIIDTTWMTENWRNTGITDMIYQAISKMPGLEAVAKYKSTSADECGIYWPDLITDEQRTEAERMARLLL